MAATSATRLPSGECCFSIAVNADWDVVMHASSGPYSDFTCARRGSGTMAGRASRDAEMQSDTRHQGGQSSLHAEASHPLGH